MATAPRPTLDLKVLGLDCAEEAKQIKHALRGMIAEEHLNFDFLNGRLRVNLSAYDVSEEHVRVAIARTGMRTLPWEEHQRAGRATEPFLQRHGRSVFAAASGISLALAFTIHALRDGVFTALTAQESTTHSYPPAAMALYLFAIAIGLFPLLPKAWVSIRALRPDIHLLVVIAAVGAVALGNYAEASLVVFLFAISLWLEGYSVERARHAVTALMALTSPTARYYCPCDGDIMEKPVAEVPLGAIVLLRPGERAPLDGTITKGATHVDQSAITGESRPIEKAPGDPLFAGSINQEGALEFRADKPASDSQLARILHLVEEARAQRAPSEQWVERFARIYTPIVLALALAVCLAMPLIGTPWADAVYAALVLLLIACPCALVISTPVTVFAGLAAAARHGVLIKGGNFLEAPAHLRAFAFDKTGTLTHGKPSVEKIVPTAIASEEEVLRVAAGLAAESQHILAVAVRQCAAARAVTPASIHAHTMRPGEGVLGETDAGRVWMGNARMAAAFGASHNGTAASQEDAAHSVVFVGREKEILGVIRLTDQPRAEAAPAIAALRKLGIRHTMLLTGDNTATARAIAEAAGVDTWRAELLPEEKVAAVRALLAEHGTVAMAGDGVNDAPALAVATVGIAMAAVGTDAAIETADIALMSDDLTLLPWLVQHSRRTLRIIKQNIAIALGLKGTVFLLSLTGHAALWLAITADMGASLLVIANGLRLLRARR